MEPDVTFHETNAGQNLVDHGGTQAWASSLRFSGGWPVDIGPPGNGHRPERPERTRLARASQLKTFIAGASPIVAAQVPIQHLAGINPEFACAEMLVLIGMIAIATGWAVWFPRLRSELQFAI